MHAQKAWCATHGEWRAGPWDQSGCNGGRTPRELLMDQLPSADVSLLIQPACLCGHVWPGPVANQLTSGDPPVSQALSKVMEQCNVDDGKLQDLNLLGAKPYPPGHCMFVAIDANSTIAKKCGKRKATTVVRHPPARPCQRGPHSGRLRAAYLPPGVLACVWRRTWGCSGQMNSTKTAPFAERECAGGAPLESQRSILCLPQASQLTVLRLSRQTHSPAKYWGKSWPTRRTGK